MTETDLQKELFVSIKNALPPHISLVDELADLLELSYDSVYRRIRGEKPISLNELKKLCEHFHLSLDQVLQFKTETVVFNAPGINGSAPDFLDYLKGVWQQLKYFNSFQKKEMLYQCKDAPIFYFYLFPEIGAFKTFCWLRSILNNTSYHDKLFSLQEFPFEECNQMGQQIIKEYSILPSTEVWNFESLNSSLNQLEYYRDAGLFKSDKDFSDVLGSFEKMLDHIQDQAQIGFKYMPTGTDKTHKAPFKFYVNQVILGNNTFLLDLDGVNLSIINYNVLDYMMTKDVRFGKKLLNGFNTLINSSTLISGTGEKERNKFFRIQRDKVSQLRK
ncbi:MAG: helix-turn-helix domain-containing protein [Ginsengibacter sp.]